MKKFLILLLLLFPSLVYGLIIMGSNTNSSPALPIVTTTAATNLAPTSATLNGTAYNYNSAGNSFFNYGTTISYGSQTSQTAFAANTSTTAFSANVTGLTAGTTYHFQACVSNSAGIACGGDLTFVPPAHTVLTRVATLQFGTGITSANVMAIDTTNGFLYIASNGLEVRKINLSTFTQTALLSGASTSCNGDFPNDMRIDVTGGSLYIDCSGTQRTIKISLGTFTQNGTQLGSVYTNAVTDFTNFYGGQGDATNNIIQRFTYSSGAVATLTSSGMGNGAVSAIFDNANDKFYFAGGLGGNAIVGKFNKTAFTQATTLTLSGGNPYYAAGSNQVFNYDYSAAVDLTNSFGYWATKTGVSKVNLSSFTESSFTTYSEAGIISSGVALIDTSVGRLFVDLEKVTNQITCAGGSNPSILTWFNTSTMAELASITLNLNENVIRDGAIDTVNNFVYLLVISCGAGPERGEIIKFSY